MKKRLIALAVGAAFAGIASAQSSVTMFGVLDTSLADIKNSPASGASTHTRQMLDSGLNKNRLGFRGLEDLGDGLKAGFQLETDIGVDVGSAGATVSGNSKFFGRRSTVSLFGKFGELRLGRDLNPSYWNLTVFDPFGNVGVGSLLTLVSTLGSGANTLARADNAVDYLLPSNLGGIYGQAMVAAGEGGANGTQPNNKYYGARLGYASGPVDVAAAYGQTTLDTPGAGLPAGSKYKIWNVGGAWDFGVAKVMGLWVQTKAESRQQRLWELGTVIPLGQAEIHAAYKRSDMQGGTTAPLGFRDPDDASEWSLGYVYNLSKRTALYATASRITNKGAANFVVAGPGSALGGTSTGVQGGLRHLF